MTEETILAAIRAREARVRAAYPASFVHSIPITAQRCDLKRREVLFSVQITESLANGWGVAQGGMLAAIFDTCMGQTVRAFLSCESAKTVSMQLQYLRPVPLGATLQVCVRLLSGGRTLAAVQTLAWTDDPLQPTNQASATFHLGAHSEQ